MDYVSLFLIVAILFVLWVVAVAITTHDFRMNRHLHRPGSRLGGRNH